MRESSHSPRQNESRASALFRHRLRPICNHKRFRATRRSIRLRRAAATPESPKLGSSRDSQRVGLPATTPHTARGARTQLLAEFLLRPAEVCTSPQTAQARENGTLRSKQRSAVSDLQRATAGRARAISRAVSTETPHRRREPQSPRPTAAYMVLRPNRAVAGRAPSGSAHWCSHHADKMLACRLWGAEEGAGPARIPRSPLLQRRRPLKGRSSEQFLHALLHSRPSASGRSNQQNRVVTGECADNFFPAFGIHRRGKRLSTPWRSFQHEHVLCRTNVEQKFLERPRKRRLRRSFFGCRGRERPVALRGLHQAQFAQVARERSLRHAHADMPKVAAQFVLTRHGVSREELQDLPLPVSFL